MTCELHESKDFLLQKRQCLQEKLDSLDAALAALGGGVQKTKSARSSKPCCTKREVLEILRQLLADNGTLTRQELEELAKDKLKRELGRSLSGFAMRFNEALAESQFTEPTAGCYELALYSNVVEEDLRD